MKLRGLLALSLAALSGALAFGDMADAAITLSKDSTGNIYVNGATASTKLTVEYNTPAVRSVTTDSCGLLLIKSSAKYPIGTTVHANNVAITYASLTSGVVPKCTNGTLAAPVSSTFKSSSNGEIVVPGLSPLTVYPVTYDGTTTARNATVNACGFAKLTVNPKYPTNVSLIINGTSYDPSTLSASSPPLCRSGVLYKPG